MIRTPKKKRAPRVTRHSSRRKAPDYLKLQIGSKLEGGLFAGVTYVEGRPHALVLGPESETELTWQGAIDWAKTVKGGFVLPSRLDLALLYANLRNEFRPTYYWSAEQLASDSDYAWGQGFSHGSQGNRGKSTKLRARLVRRLTIQ